MLSALTVGITEGANALASAPLLDDLRSIDLALDEIGEEAQAQLREAAERRSVRQHLVG